MDLSAVPYMIISRRLDGMRVFVCLCLVDHMVIGVGRSRDEALAAMIAELHQRHGETWRDGSSDFDVTRN